MAMGSPCEIQFFATSGDTARRASDAAMADIARLEARYSRFRDNSFLSDINRVAARGGSITVDEETAGLLDYAATCYAESGGYSILLRASCAAPGVSRRVTCQTPITSPPCARTAAGIVCLGRLPIYIFRNLDWSWTSVVW